MAQRMYTGIDIGTNQVKVVITASPQSADSPPTILATASAPSKGVRLGYVVDVKEVAEAVRTTVARAAQIAHAHVRSARVSIGGVSLEETRAVAEITLAASGGVVTARDIERVVDESEKRGAAKLLNRAILHTIPLEFRLDGIPVQGRPTGMQGNRLGVETMLISTLVQHHDDLIRAVEAAGIEVEDVMASPLAASLVTLSKAQKMAGVCLANLGADTTAIVVFENDIPASLKVFPVGSNELTNALALAFQLPLPEAEQLKRGAVIGSTIPPKKLAQIVAAKLKEMFTLINSHLKVIHRERLLPAGIVLTGGGAGIAAAAEVARTTLKLPSQIGLPMMTSRTSPLDATWAIAFGLCRWGYADDMSGHSRPIGDILSRMVEAVKNLFRSLLP